MGAKEIALECLTILFALVVCASHETEDSVNKIQFEAAFQGLLISFNIFFFFFTFSLSTFFFRALISLREVFKMFFVDNKKLVGKKQ